MSTESPPQSPQRFRIAVDSLRSNISLHELSYMLVAACEEAIAEGKDPIKDPAVILISGRIGFASPADTMSPETWGKLVWVCESGSGNAEISIRKDAFQ